MHRVGIDLASPGGASVDQQLQSRVECRPRVVRTWIEKPHGKNEAGCTINSSEQPQRSLAPKSPASIATRLLQPRAGKGRVFNYARIGEHESWRLCWPERVRRWDAIGPLFRRILEAGVVILRARLATARGLKIGSEGKKPSTAWGGEGRSDCRCGSSVITRFG